MGYNAIMDVVGEAIETMVVRSDGVFVLVDGENEDTGQYRAWLAAGNSLGEPIRPPAPAPPPISDRQFAQQLAILGTITEAEALAWAARGEPPEAMETAIEGLPPAERFSARMLLSSATTYERSHPLVPMLAALLGYDEAELDDLWRAAAQL